MGRKPRIVKETRRRRVVVEPPPWEEHDWGPTVHEDGPKVLLEKRCVDQLIAHCGSQAEKGIEAMGFLAGGVFSWDGGPYTVARDAVTTELDASAVSVRYNRDGFPELFKRLDGLGYDYILVGWYHSHPGYGCYMSDTDIDTQSKGFGGRHQFALVVDPEKREMEGFVLREGGQDVDNIGIGIYREDEWPWPLKRKE